MAIISAFIAAILAFFGIGSSIAPEPADTTKPTVALSAPVASTFDSSDTDLVVAASDNRGLGKVVANIYKDGALFASTQSDAAGATSFTHTVDLAALPGVGLLPVGAYSVRYNALDGAGNLSTTKTFAFTVVDKVKPVAVLVTPSASGPLASPSLDITVTATDERGLNRIVANIYQGGLLVKSTQTPVGGAASGTHSATAALADGTYEIRFNASDLAGNIAATGSMPVTIDNTAPTVTAKDGSTDAEKSFKLYDAGKIDKVTLNGVEKNLSDNAWSDLNGVKPGAFGAVEGPNTLVVFDVAGNATTVSFLLDTVAPVVTIVAPADGALLRGVVPVTVELFDVNLQSYNLRIDSAGLQYQYQASNGPVAYSLDTTTLTDGVHTLLATATDKVGRKSTQTIKVTVDNTAPALVGVEQVYQAKENGRIAVTATFSEPLAAAPGQGWYGSGTTYTKVYYSAKAQTISFADIAGNAGSGEFTVIPVVAPVG